MCAGVPASLSPRSPPKHCAAPCCRTGLYVSTLCSVDALLRLRRTYEIGNWGRYRLVATTRMCGLGERRDKPGVSSGIVVLAHSSGRRAHQKK